MERDFEAIHDHEELGMIDYSVICPTPPAIGAVVVVDPFSSGEWVLLCVVYLYLFVGGFSVVSVVRKKGNVGWAAYVYCIRIFLLVIHVSPLLLLTL